MDAGSSAPTVRRAATRGRPRKLTVEAIVAATRTLLADHAPADVTFARVACSLGVPGSSVYNYFPNRDALFAAVAAELFASFAFDDPGDDVPWQMRLRTWLAAIDRFFDQNPMAFRLMATSSQASPAWVHVRMPLLQVLRALGFEGRDLALIHAWFEGQVTGLLLVESHAGRNRLIAGEPPQVPIDMNDEAECAELDRRSHLPSIRREEIVKLGFDALVSELERQVADRC
ncbi:AcrR family transcriptional regulator [Sphingobium sp. OAS761]|uniref:TetR/AcrR family transcriptional regulator n=1 Tax=Sphingobium sp. OAS761 TaxID=2817901 RepID=UPI00209CDA84|nr:TetR/AcrR family transcriptional regulator [Sphingobium sp. OAS761]MCP1470367.1 AcrR family transcriptional regulator [Sphingobium sp. OAS761]